MLEANVKQKKCRCLSNGGQKVIPSFHFSPLKKIQYVMKVHSRSFRECTEQVKKGRSFILCYDAYLFFYVLCLCCGESQNGENIDTVVWN